MPSYKGTIENGQCIIGVQVIPFSNTNQQVELEDSNIFRALIDTGAQRTCVSKKIVNSLGVSPESKTKMQSATQVISVNQYRLGIFIPIVTTTPTGIIEGKVKVKRHLSLFGSENTLTMEFTSNSGQFEVIIGMDMLAHCNFFMAHGEFVLSY